MADSVRIEPTLSPDGEPLDRETKIEDLLVAGLDHYFAGEYEHSINVWTRVLFLDRSHARARAYIERARRALAERQRETEELVHRGVAAFDRGEGSLARNLLTTALARGGPQDIALSFLERLDRLESSPGGVMTASEPVTPASTPPPDPQSVEPAQPVPPTRPVRVFPLVLLAVLVVAGALIAASWDALRPLMQLEWQWRPAATATSTAAVEERLPLPRAAELAIGHARTLMTTGHLQDALRALDGVTPADPLYPDAERLRATIQQALLSNTKAIDPRMVTGARGTAPAAETSRE
jgi:hypothetical protein